ncbi:MAG: sigma-70 family RNA polymerase sigma factor [Lachnospira sp.]|nr:sigma-70 family RNA polymerase sigma factor [Lachnospira sp.]
MTTKELEQLLDRYGDSIYGFCLHLTGCKEQADDLYQDTFLKTIEIQPKIKLSNMEQDLLSAKNYIIGIAIRLWKKTLTKNKRTVQDVSLEDYLEYFVNPEDVAVQTEKRKLLSKLTGSDLHLLVLK